MHVTSKEVCVRERVCGYREEEALGLLNANKKLNSHFQHVIPPTQLDI